MTYHVTYPSGRRFTVVGRTLGTISFVAGVRAPVIDPGPPGTIQVLDPRAVIHAADGRIVFAGCTTHELEHACDQTDLGPDGFPLDPDARRAAVDGQFDEYRARLDALDARRPRDEEP